MRPDLRRTWVWPIAALVVLFAGDRILGLVFDHLLTRSQTRYSLLYKGGQQNELVVFGDSRGACACSTPLMEQTLDKPCLNLSHNYLGIAVAEALFRDYLDHNSPPKLLVMEVSNLTTNTYGTLDNLKPYWRCSPRLSAMARERYPAEVAGSRVSHLYGFNSEMFLRILYHLRCPDQEGAHSAAASPGFVHYVEHLPPTRLGPPPPERLAALQRILAVADQHGIEVRLFVSPILPAYREKLTDFEAWLTAVQESLGAEHRVWDFSKALHRREAFADRVHINGLGSRLLLEEMVSAGFFAAPRRPEAESRDTSVALHRRTERAEQTQN